jgi:hypothetical protein
MPGVLSTEVPKEKKGQLNFIKEKVEGCDGLRQHICNVLMDPNTNSAVRRLIKKMRGEWTDKNTRYMHDGGTKWMMEMLIVGTEILEEHGGPPALKIADFKTLAGDRIEKAFCWFFRVKKKCWLPHLRLGECEDRLCARVGKEMNGNPMDFGLLWTDWETDGYVQLASKCFSPQDMTARGLDGHSVISLKDPSLFIQLPARENDWEIRNNFDTNEMMAYSANAGSDNGTLKLMYEFRTKYGGLMHAQRDESRGWLRSWENILPFRFVWRSISFAGASPWPCSPLPTVVARTRASSQCLVAKQTAWLGLRTARRCPGGSF